MGTVNIYLHASSSLPVQRASSRSELPSEHWKARLEFDGEDATRMLHDDYRDDHRESSCMHAYAMCQNAAERARARARARERERERERERARVASTWDALCIHESFPADFFHRWLRQRAR